MGQKRSKDQIIFCILDRCNKNGCSKTQVVYASGLNFKTVVPYLSNLLKNNLIEINPDPLKKYRITSKGNKALEHLRELESLIK
jgi:predicted transcriptional regulator